MLSREEQEYLAGRLSDVLQANPRGLLATAVPAAMNKIPIIDMPLPLMMKAVEVCVADRWNNDPTWLFLLLTLLPNEERVVAIRLRIVKPPAQPNAGAATVLATDEPFVDREELRRKTQALLPSVVQRPILVVKGEPKTGKTFTERYVSHLRLSGESIDYCHIKFPSGSGRTLGPEQVAKTILEGAGVDLGTLSPNFFQNTTNGDRFPYDLALSVINTCSRVLQNQYWILLDGFSGTDLRDDTRKFVDGLGESLTRNTILGKKFRLLLLGFEKTALTVQPATVDVEDLKLPGVTHVTECVGAIFDRFAQPRPADLVPLVNRIMDGLPQGQDWMPELYNRLADLLSTVREDANA